MRTYSRSGIKDLYRLFKRNIFSTTDKARKDYQNYLKIKENMEDFFKTDLNNKLILDIGCGQRFPYTYLFSKNNRVIGIDLDVILIEHGYKNYISIIKENGVNRFFKTFVRSLLFDRAYFDTLSKLNNQSKIQNFSLLNMNAEKLEFPDNTFDFVISINSFEHLKDVEKSVKELKRVLKKGGGFYISIDLFTKFYGGHKMDPKNPWVHLWDKSFNPNVFLNKLELDDYKKIFNNYFEKLEFIYTESKEAKKLLTPEKRKKLKDYSEIELIMNPLIVIGEK